MSELFCETSACFSLPYRKSSGENAPYLLLQGGYSTWDKGCPAWGTNQSTEAVYFGDLLGHVVIAYASGAIDRIPLIFSYTVWCSQLWKNPRYGSPFRGAYIEEAMRDRLRETLHLRGAFEGSDEPVLCIRLRRDAVREISVEPCPEKPGEVRFSLARFAGEDIVGADDFWKSHTIDSRDPYPKRICDHVCHMRHRLLTFEADFSCAPLYRIPDPTTAVRVAFSGTPLSDIATGIVHENLMNLKERVRKDGFTGASYEGAPSWLYDGFEMWADHMGSYESDCYSRDTARAILTLSEYGEAEEADRALRFSNRWMMYYPEHHLQLNGKDIPGHFSVIVNKPLVYSTFLTHHGWPTRYTKERFGDTYENLGNPETDGHGLMMMADYLVWKNGGKSLEWVQENWAYIREAADWIVWCYANPEESFMENDLLYGETEAAMNDYTMYSNLSCLLGLRGCIEMARTVGEDEAADGWEKIADRLFRAIDRHLSLGDVWNPDKYGLYHDPLPAFFCDIYGFDAASHIPPAWLERSRNTFLSDLSAHTHGQMIGPTGISYDHSILTQNAMILDLSSCYGTFLTNLTKMCYAPRLPHPYMIPECVSVDPDKGVFRRQGDLGNLVQMADGLKCFLLACGVGSVQDGTLTVMPRLPEKWHMAFENADVSVSTACPDGESQTVLLTAHRDIGKVRVRMGPFSPNRNHTGRVNGKDCELLTVSQGDALWGWMELDGVRSGETFRMEAFA